MQAQTQPSRQLRVRIPQALEVEDGQGKETINLYEFARYVLGYSKLGVEHKLWERQLYHAVNEQRLHKLVLLKPRGTYKTTFYTVSLPIWFLFQNPNLRILIANAVEDNAKKFLSEITGHYLRNENLEHLYQVTYGTGVPIDPRGALSTSVKLKNCTKIQKEPNIATIGYGSSIVSQHFDIIIVDDLCDRNDRESVTVREDKKRWFSDLASLLEPDGLLLIIGTRWHFNDVYSYIIDELNPKHAPQDKYHVEVESCYKQAGGQKVAAFPRILSLAKLEELKIDKTPSEFMANYENNPLPSEAAVFKLNEMTFFDMNELRDRKNLMYYGFCDPALGRKEGDYSALITIAVDDNGIIYVVDAIIERLLPSTMKDRILLKGATTQYVKVGIEDNGFQELFMDEIRQESTRRQLYIPIEGVNHSTNKKGRIESMQPLTHASDQRQGIVRFRKDWLQAYPLLIEQLLQFPAGAHDDAPDALEAAVSLARAGEVASTDSVFITGGAIF